MRANARNEKTLRKMREDEKRRNEVGVTESS